MVEDDLAFTALVTQIVREEGGQPTHCKTLAEARAVTAHRTFDLILLDNHLPDGKAYDFFDQLSRRNPDAPIIMITGLPALSEAIALTRNGLFDYLTKPVETDVLIACLRRARLRMRQPGNRDSDLAAFGNSAAMRGLLQHIIRQSFSL